MIAEVEPHIESGKDADEKVTKVKEAVEPKPYWKFAIKASFVQTDILAQETEIFETK